MSEGIIIGKAHKFGDNINTDLINPAQYMELPLDEMAKHAMEGAGPDFYKKAKPGDIIVAGKNFGSGSSRETAPMVIKHCGIAAVIAVSFARIFYRNAINIGLPVLICDEAGKIREDSALEVDFTEGIVKNLTDSASYKCSSLPKHIMELVNDGGLIPHLKRKQKG
jgi:3-isopropylmalate/(R)-2-methylmalate dehydratase small subunit